jgi:PilZ domain-containing protein
MAYEDRLQRNYCKIFFRVLNGETGEQLGNLVDLTVDGLRMVSSTRINPDAIYYLKLVLPTEIEGVSEVTISAISRWCNQDTNPEFFNAGFEFRNISMKHIKVVRQIIEQFCT